MAELSSGLLQGMTVAVTGASGNVGTALLRRLAGAGVAEVRGLARRRPPDEAPYDRVRWYLADLSEPDSEQVLAEFLDGVDAVVHLAWALLPDRKPELLHRVNVEGTERVLAAGGAAGGGGAAPGARVAPRGAPRGAADPADPGGLADHRHPVGDLQPAE